MSAPSLAILGIRGIPASHGGFETFAERLALYLVAQGWKVTVYCQDVLQGHKSEDYWNGVRRINIPSKNDDALSTMIFDWEAIADSLQNDFDVSLTLGYNTAAFCARLRLAGRPNVINMDGIEWAREKWSWGAKLWLYLNDWAGCKLGNKLIADHPEIAKLLESRTDSSKITMIPYGADSVTDAPVEPLLAYGLVPGKYVTVIARPEPENSVLEIVEAFSKKPRNVKLCVLGRYNPKDSFHAKILASASDEVLFVGAIYDRQVLQSLRFHSLAYVHGHRVGGTNPSLVEALGAGNAVLAHDNRFNRWVAGDAGIYFSDTEECATRFDELLENPEISTKLGLAARRRHESSFIWGDVLKSYESVLLEMVPIKAEVFERLPNEKHS